MTSSPRLKQTLAALVATTIACGNAAADDREVEGKTLVIIDGGDSGRDKVRLIAKGEDLAKGGNDDPDQIGATIEIERGAAAAVFSVPRGALGDADAGWRDNDAARARYENRDASSGVPTGVRSLQLKPGKRLKIDARTLGDEPFALGAALSAQSSIRAVATISNGDETYRHCTAFSAERVKVVGPNASGRTKLIARKGLPTACPGLLLEPQPPLPPAPAAPHLYFDGGDAAAVAAVLARVGDAATAAFFASFKSTADAALGGLASANDDTRARVAKAAALLHFLGETPPGGSPYATYAEAAVAALLGIGDRTPLDSVDKFLTPPPNLLHVLHDSGRLQSMVEAYDLLRSATVDAGDDQAIRTTIATWADAYVEDWNLIGDPFGFFPGHRNNWAIKAGSALVSTALALPEHESAQLWLDSGVAYLNNSLREVVTAPGWYTESPHYVNYSLNNLASTAWHVRNATGTDWFDDLAPLVDTALALRQPDGQSAAFEEGVPNVFPYDVLAAAYPTRAPRMLWAWQESAQNPVSYDNQQIHSVTRFLVVDIDTVAAPPNAAPTVFLDGDTHAAALRSGWDPGATQLTTLTAVDHSDSEQFASRHNMENPLELAFYAAGALLLPPGGGGPEVTSSVNRSQYLEPGSKNIPLVDGDAPYLLDPLSIELGERLDSADDGGVVHRLLDAATTRVAEFADGVAVERTVALVDDLFAVAVDRFDASLAHDYGATWRGRGEATTRTLTAGHLGVDYAYPTTAAASAHLQVDVTADTALGGVVDSGLYAPAWGVEETLQPLRVSASDTQAVFLSILRPRLDGAAASAITRPSGDTAFRVSTGADEYLIGAATGGSFSADGVTSNAELAVVRRSSGVTTGMAIVGGTTVETADALIETSETATLSVGTDTGSAVVTVSRDVQDKLIITLDLPELDAATTYTATFDGAPLTGNAFKQDGSELTVRVPHGGSVVIEPI